MRKKKEGTKEAKKHSRVKIKDLKLRKEGEGVKGGRSGWNLETNKKL